MADRTIQTRIITKHAELDKWLGQGQYAGQGSNLELKEGEIVLAKVMIPQSDGTEAPTFVAKVGNNTTFANSPWLFAKASDVYAWAKKSSLDIVDIPVLELDAAAVAKIKEAIDTKVSTSTYEAKISSLEDSISTLTQALEDLGGASADTYATKDDLNAVDAKAEANADAIEAINAENTGILAQAKSYADTQFATEKSRAEGEESGIKGRLDTVEGAIDTINDESTGILKTAKDYTDTEVAKALGAASTAQSAADKAQEEVDALEQTVATNKSEAESALSTEAAAIRGEFASADNTVRGEFAAADTQIRTDFAAADTALDGKITQNTNSIATEKSERESADTTLGNRITEVEGKLANVTNVMDFVGAVAAVPTDSTGYQKGDVIVVTEGDDKGKEYVFDGENFVEFGSVDAQQTAINTLQDAVEALETNKADKTALATEKSDREAADTTLQGNIDTLSGTVTANKNAYDAYVTSNNDRVKAVEDDVAQNTTDISGITSRVEAIENDYLTSEDEKALTDSITEVNTTLTEAINSVSATVTANKTAYDKHVSDTETRIAGIEGDISGLESDVSGLNTTVGEMDTAYKAADAGLAEDISGLDGRLTTAEGDIEALEGAVATKAEQSVVGAIDSRLEEVESSYAKVVSTGEGLYALMHGADTIIFDCGGAE